MTYTVAFTPRAEKELSKIDRPTRERIAGAIDLLAIDPRPPASLLLRGGEHDRWRVRIGNYRVIYSIDDGVLVVLVIRVAHRREVYE